MDNESEAAEDQSTTENDDVDGSVISRLRRKRGVKVTGKYIPPLEWERLNATHSITSLNNSYFENIYNGMGENFQASALSTKLLLKDEREGTAQTDDGGDHTPKTESEKQRKEPVVSLQVPYRLHSKNAENVLQEKIKAKNTSTKSSSEKANNDVLPLGSAIPKETLAELKIILKESPLIHRNTKWNPKTSTSIATIKHPKSTEKFSEQTGLTFETFHPHLSKENQKLHSTKNPESEQTHMIEQSYTGSVKAEEKHGQSSQHINENQELIPDKLIITSGSKIDAPSNKLNASIHTSNKDEYPHASGIQNTVYLKSHIEQIKQQIAREDICFVRFEAADLHGVSRSKTIPARFFQEKVANGIWMPVSYLELTLQSKNNLIERINSAHLNSDIILKPDLPTFRILPWTEKTARVICDSFTFLGEPLFTSPRNIAKRLLNQLQESGFLLHSSFTYDFFISGFSGIMNSKTIPLPAATLLTPHDQSFMQELFDGMYYIGGNIDSFSSSSGPGQMEISFQPEYGLTSADNAFTFKTAIKQVAKKHNYMASFHTNVVGLNSSGVLSHSLWDVNGTNNLFYSEAHVQELTDFGKKWLSGLLLHSAAISCLVAPNVSCSKHLSKEVIDSQDNTCATWGFNNNSCTYNIKSHGCNGTYIINQMCSATANPYLVLAATIAAGLDGIKKGLNLYDGTVSTTGLAELKASPVPLKLDDALSALEEDTCFRESLGEPFIQYFVAMKRYEIDIEEVEPARDTFLEYFI